MLFRNKKNFAVSDEIDKNNLPKHIGIIMDGNGRWAKKRGLVRSAGHSAGGENFRRMGYYLKSVGVKYMTAYAFSTENWKRPQDEVSAIMGLLEKYLEEAIEKMRRDNIAIQVLGDLTPLSPRILSLVESVNEVARTMTPDLVASVCVNYGGRDEIVHAARKTAALVRDGIIKDINEKMFADYLYTANMPDPDLIIRPSGEIRISNFLLWQSAYAEYYFTDVLWPDFNEKEMEKAIIAYQKRSRRFGGI